MQNQDLTYLLQHPETITPFQTEALLHYTKKYPYCQSIKALYLKGLKQKNSYKYNNALKITAAYTSDRSVLFDYITSDIFNQNEISKQIKQSLEHIKDIEVNDKDDISVNKSVIIDDALKAHIKATENVLNPNLFKSKSIEQTKKEIWNKKQIIDDYSHTEKPITKTAVPIENKLNIGKPFNFNKSEIHSFSEWLKIASYKPIVRQKESTERTLGIAPLEDKLAIIDRFLEENPKIKPVLNQDISIPKLITEEDIVSENLMTETLARIYLEQKSYDKAIQSYKILSLKYPEKSSFFADRIKLVEELKDNTI